jgi:hypothetical protein
MAPAASDHLEGEVSWLSWALLAFSVFSACMGFRARARRLRDESKKGLTR